MGSKTKRLYIFVFPEAQRIYLTITCRYIVRKILVPACIFTTIIYMALVNEAAEEVNTRNEANAGYELHRQEKDMAIDSEKLRSAPDDSQDYLLPVFRNSMEQNSAAVFSIEPKRILGPEGILNLRNIQGNSWSGSIMKGVLVTFVESSPQNRHLRDLARRTWASIRDITGWKLETIFLVQLSRKEMWYIDGLRMECDAYEDLLVFKETSRSSTSRIRAAMQWVSQKLPGDFYIAFTADDNIINIDKVKNFMSSQRPDIAPHNTVQIIKVYNSSSILSPVPQLIYCFGGLNDDSQIRLTGWLRDPVITVNIGFDMQWPPYCRSGMFASSSHMIKELHKTATVTYDANVEPILFVTGILRRKLRRGDDNIVDAHPIVGVMFKTFSEGKRQKHLFGLYIESFFTKQWEEWVDLLKWKTVVMSKYT